MYQKYTHYKLGNYHFSNIELKDLAKSLVAISAVFAIAFTGGRFWSSEFLVAFSLSLFIVGVGFVFHEMSHKFLAQRYGCKAEFRSNDVMLILAMLIAFSGFIFIAPGAVIIGGKQITVKQNGKISAAGPLMNILLAIVFFFLSLVLVGNVLGTIMQYGFILNSLLAVFNMLPIGNFDGRKVLHWNKAVWLGMIAVSGFLFIVSYGGLF